MGYSLALPASRDHQITPVTEAGELKSLSELGIVSINLHAQTGTTVDHGNLLGLVSSYTTSDGQTKAIADVWFQKEASSSASASDTTVTLTDVLSDGKASSTASAALATLSGTSADSSTSTATVAAASTDTNTTVVVDVSKDLLEQQNNVTPLI